MRRNQRDSGAGSQRYGKPRRWSERPQHRGCLDVALAEAAPRS
jgi:hypothetical protein